MYQGNTPRSNLQLTQSTQPRQLNRTKLALAIVLASLSSASLAQNNQDDTRKTNSTASSTTSAETTREAIEEITVTGSRIKRDGFNTSTPMVVIGRGDIDVSGINELSEYLVTIPGVSAGLSTKGSQLSTQNAGLSSIQLRNLGDNRTLVLIDGRRTVSNSANANRVSLSTIPSAFVERVEITTGAASAVYGSDAVAGVVNIITDDDFEGTRLDLKSGESLDGGGHEDTLEFSFGSKFNQERGYFLLSATYDKEGPLRATDRDWALIQADYDYDDGINEMYTVDGDRPMSEITRADWADGANDTPGGHFENIWFDENGEHSGDFQNARDGYDSRPFNLLSIPRERSMLAAKVDYQLTSGWTAFSQLQYSKVDTLSTRTPEGFDYADSYAYTNPGTGLQEQRQVGEIPEGNPLTPANAGDGDIEWDRSFGEVGNQINDNSRETLRFWSGLRGQVLDGWDAEISLGYGRYQQDQTRRNELNLINLTHALNAETGPDGQIRCASAEARAGGCVPVDLFGVGSISAEAVDYIRANLTLEPVIQQTNVQAYISGDLLQLPAGPLGLAAGVEYRRDEIDVTTDKLSQFGGASAATIPSYQGGYDVSEAFVEANIPLVKGAPGAAYFGLEAAARHADYSIDTVNQVSSYSFGALWRPVEALLIRAKFGLSQRAPDLTELYSPPRGDFDDINDICEGVTADTAGTVAHNCRLNPGIAAAIAAEGVFDPESGDVSSPNAGNLALQEESGKSFTAGIVYQPTFLDDLTLSVDYYEIEVEDAISYYSNSDILEQCYGNSIDPTDNRFCDLITRDGDGQLARVVQTSENLNELLAHGIDTQVRYHFAPAALPGDFQLQLVHSHLAKLEQHSTGLDGEKLVDLRKGELDSDAPENRAHAALTWSNGNWRLRWTSQYIGSMLDSHEREEDYFEDLEEYPNAEVPAFLYLDSVITHHLSASYTHDFNNMQLRYYGGLRNITDETGPFLPGDGDVTSDRNGNYNGFYDIRGRYGYLGLTVTF